MKKLPKIIATSLIAVASCGQLLAADHEVKMLNAGADGTMVFEPGYLNVAPGDTVKFVPTDAGHNTVSSITPEGGTTWKGTIGEEVSVKIDTEGVYVYLCEPHTALAMVGVIQVGKADNLSDAQKAAKELSTKFAVSKDRLDKYMAQVK
jgi:pseudoazurin